uniref:beta-glucosidase n=1 Tax=uncultured microorganism TaxID=358574 RepID=A0A387IGB9_9ZZZZ|nr:beta-glycosidase [uncultured microorganism]
MQEYQFPKDFLWGAATASYQIEGAIHEDGRSESVWDRFARTPGKVDNGDTGDTACDHYHRYPEDIAIMRDLGVKAYRFSIAWPRILPDGDGAVNEAGLDFYERLVDGLLEAGIAPFATLFHWDMPQVLQDRQQGFLDRAIVDQFAHYADVVSQRLGDRVAAWATLNEPRVFTELGHLLGIHAPGVQDKSIIGQVAHHLMLAHGTAIPVLRSNIKNDAKVGIVLTMSPIEFGNEATDADRERWSLVDATANRWFGDPIFLGSYPQELLESPEFPGFTCEPGDLETINQPLDFLGLNYYQRTLLGQNGAVLGSEYSAMDWEVHPDGLYKLLKRLDERYHIPELYVTENGAAFVDVVTENGRVHDTRRVAFLDGHFAAAARAVNEGVPLKGYFVWSLLDNFEWAYGYSMRFGVVHVDFETQQRTLKDSALFYRDVIANTYGR